ncbi:hypothetical protein J132_03375 [Termitomyces sp. J132]|nr:hypothetical protein J132_03375 [Termitomyces sp. J132]
MLDPCWEPRWIREEREPRFNTAPSDDLPAYDCLRLPHNETERDAIHRDFKLCFAASGDIRNLVQTINGLPAGYRGKKGLRSKRTTITDTRHVDDVDRAFASLQPAHRLALAHFRRKGVLAPFSLSTRGFSEPNRLMYTAGGDWLGHAGVNPLKGWNVSDVLATGAKYAVDSADIIGCLFFHVKEELMEFTRRIKEFYIDLHVTQFSPPLLSKGISIGVFPAFAEGCFDRVDTADITDREGIPELLADWGPMQWHRNRPNTTAQSNPCSAVMLIERCKKLPSLRIKLASVLTHGTKSPALMRLLESLDAFIDHEKAFREYLCAEQVDMIAKDLGLRVRQYNHVNSKRFGVSIDAPQQRLPSLSRSEFYNLFMIGGGDLLTRFVEFEATH